MALTSWIRRQFKDGVITTATTTMTAGATTFTVNTGAGATFPDGSVGPFIVTVDQLQASEEKILVQTRSADTFTVATSPNNGRGYNGTSAQQHTNATVLHTIDAQDFDEANQVANQTLGAVQASGDLLQGSAANALARLARGTNGQFLQAGASSLAWVTATAAMIANAADKSSGSTQSFTGAVSTSGNLSATGNLTVSGTAAVTGDTTVTGRIIPNGGTELFGLLTPGLNGTATATTGFLIQAATSVPTASAGAFTINFPNAFPNGVLTVICSGASNGAAMVIGPSSTTLSSFSGTCFDKTGAGPTGAVRINWIAIGW